MISKLHYVSQGETPIEHLENIQKACTYGADWVQLRLKDLSDETILKTAQKAREITAHFQTRLIINDHFKVAKEVKADGVHLGKADNCPIEVRKYLGKSYTIGGTANTLEDCKALIDKKVDYIGLGPFRFTKTKKNLSPTLGVQGYSTTIKKLQTGVPIIAIGGITVKDIPEMMNTGIHGIALSREITRNFSNIATLNKMLKQPAIYEQPHKFNKEQQDNLSMDQNK